MDIDIPTSNESNSAARDRLNGWIAVSVAVLSGFMAGTKGKNDNIVQAMMQAKSDAVDTWNQYQAKRIRQSLAEASRRESEALSVNAAPETAARLHEESAHFQSEAQRYQSDEEELQQKARDFEA